MRCVSFLPSTFVDPGGHDPLQLSRPACCQEQLAHSFPRYDFGVGQRRPSEKTEWRLRRRTCTLLRNDFFPVVCATPLIDEDTVVCMFSCKKCDGRSWLTESSLTHPGWIVFPGDRRRNMIREATCMCQRRTAVRDGSAERCKIQHNDGMVKEC